MASRTHLCTLSRCDDLALAHAERGRLADAQHLQRTVRTHVGHRDANLRRADLQADDDVLFAHGFNNSGCAASVKRPRRENMLLDHRWGDAGGRFAETAAAHGPCGPDPAAGLRRRASCRTSCPCRCFLSLSDDLSLRGAAVGFAGDDGCRRGGGPRSAGRPPACRLSPHRPCKSPAHFSARAD